MNYCVDLNFCHWCRRETYQPGYFSKNAGFMCMICAGLHGFVKVRIIPCGQSCPDYEGWCKYPKKIKTKRMGRLKKGDILPACGHRISVKIIRFLRQEGSKMYFKVRSVGEKFSKEPWECDFYGNPKTKIWVQ